jgi:hypothetical protein
VENNTFATLTSFNDEFLKFFNNFKGQQNNLYWLKKMHTLQYFYTHVSAVEEVQFHLVYYVLVFQWWWCDIFAELKKAKLSRTKLTKKRIFRNFKSIHKKRADYTNSNVKHATFRHICWSHVTKIIFFLCLQHDAFFLLKSQIRFCSVYL